MQPGVQQRGVGLGGAWRLQALGQQVIPPHQGKARQPLPSPLAELFSAATGSSGTTAIQGARACLAPGAMAALPPATRMPARMWPVCAAHSSSCAWLPCTSAAGVPGVRFSDTASTSVICRHAAFFDGGGAAVFVHRVAREVEVAHVALRDLLSDGGGTPRPALQLQRAHRPGPVCVEAPAITPCEGGDGREAVRERAANGVGVWMRRWGRTRMAGVGSWLSSFARCAYAAGVHAAAGKPSSSVSSSFHARIQYR